MRDNVSNTVILNDTVMTFPLQSVPRFPRYPPDILFPLFPSSIIRFATNKRLEKKRRIKLARAQEYLHSITRYLKIDG